MTSRAERKLWRSLSRRKGRDATGLFLAEGPKLLRELLRASPEAVTVEVVLFSSVARDSKARAGPEPGSAADLDAARERGWRVEEVEARHLAEVADAATPQPVLAVARIPDWGWQDAGGAGILLLDGVQDPGNVGTLIRTAEAARIGAVVALPGSADPWGPKAVRASAGSGLRLPVFRAGREEALAELSRRRIPLWAADKAGEPLARSEPTPRPLALALGSEAHGLSPEIARGAERIVAIAMAGGVESLNVAAAGAILLDRVLSGPASGGSERAGKAPAASGPEDAATPADGGKESW